MLVTLLCCRRPGTMAPPTSRSDLLLRSVCAGRDAADLHLLSEAVAGSARRRPAEPRPRAAGLIEEFTSRPDRIVEGWLAMPDGRDHEGGRPVGLVSLVASRGVAGVRHSIGWLLVHPAARGRGVGRALVAHACRRAAEQAAGPVWVECRADWTAAMAFWRAVGFERPA